MRTLRNLKVNTVCDCRVCTRYREFNKKLQQTPEDLREYFNNIFKELNCVEEDLECANIYLHNLRGKYPEIYKEVHTISNINETKE